MYYKKFIYIYIKKQNIKASHNRKSAGYKYMSDPDYNNYINSKILVAKQKKTKI